MHRKLSLIVGIRCRRGDKERRAIKESERDEKDWHAYYMICSAGEVLHENLWIWVYEKMSCHRLDALGWCWHWRTLLQAMFARQGFWDQFETVIIIIIRWYHEEVEKSEKGRLLRFGGLRLGWGDRLNFPESSSRVFSFLKGPRNLPCPWGKEEACDLQECVGLGSIDTIRKFGASLGGNWNTKSAPPREVVWGDVKWLNEGSELRLRVHITGGGLLTFVNATLYKHPTSKPLQTSD